MYEVISSSGAHFALREGSVDRQSVEWVSRSLFVETMRGVDIAEHETVLDLGAHVGSFSVLAAKEKQCHVVGFEPDLDSLRIAQANVLLNGVEARVRLFRHAVAGRSGRVTLHEVTESWGHTLVAGGGPYNPLTGRTNEVASISLQRALSFAPREGCALLKFNIEGAEFDMFEAASDDVLRRIRVLVGEVHYDLGNGDVRQIVKKLEDCGFAVDLVPEGDVRGILVARMLQPRLG